MDRPEYAYSGAATPSRSNLGDMLWPEDQREEHSEEMRHALKMLRRAMLVAALVAGVLMAFATFRV